MQPPSASAGSNDATQSAPAPVAGGLAAPSAAAKATPSQLDPDGNDESAGAEVALPEHAHFEKVGRHWGALERICDFAVLGDALYMAHATRPLGFGGATVTRYQPSAKPAFALAFDWNRQGEPEKGGGAGQGFLRVRAIDGRLYVPDADPPYLGLATAKPIEGYVFASDAQGKFAGARMPGRLPPRAASADLAGSFVLPGVLHGFDVIRFRGKLYASSSAMIPPNGNAVSSPGTLLTPGGTRGHWQVAFTYAGAPGEASVRLGYMTRFRDRLYVAVSPLAGIDRHDYVVIAPPRERSTIEQGDAHPVQATPSGRAHTLRWYTDRGKLYWLSIDAGGASLRVSEDGEHFRVLSLPAYAGAPSDILRVGEQLLVLAEQGLFELVGDVFKLRAAITEAKTPFKVDDGYCAPPLAAFQGNLYFGDQLHGALWKLVAD